MDRVVANAEAVIRFAKLGRYFKWIYVAAVAATLVYLLSGTSGLAFDWRRWMGSVETYVFCLAWAVMVAIIGKAWAVGLEQMSGVRLEARIWFPAQTSAWAGRYLPGKIGLFAGKLALLKRTDVAVSALTVSVLYEQLAFVAAGVAITLISPVPLSIWASFLGPIASVLDHPAVLMLVASMAAIASFVAARWMRSRLPLISPRWPIETTQVLLLHALAHLVVGLGFHGLVVKMAISATLPSIWYSIGALAAAHVAGALAIFAPAGLGVREVVLAAALFPFMPFQAAIALATVARVLTLIVDAMLFVLGRTLARATAT